MGYIHTQAVEGWLNGVMTGRRSRSRSVPHAIGLPGSKLYVCRTDDSTGDNRRCGGTSDVAQRFWRVVALGNSNRSLLATATPPVFSIPDLGIPYYVPEVLDRVLEMVLQTAAFTKGWLAVRSGDFFDIKACAGCINSLGERIKYRSESTFT